MKTSKICAIALVAICLALPFGSAHSSCSQSQDVIAVDQGNSNWCWAATMVMAEEYFSGRTVSMSNIVAWACYEGKIHNASYTCVPCGIPGLGDLCLSYYPLVNSFADLLVLRGYGYSQSPNLNLTMLQDNLCYGGVSILAYDVGGPKHAVLVHGYNDATSEYQVVDPLSGTHEIWSEADLCNHPTYSTVVRSFYLESYSADDDPIARVKYFLPVYSGGGVDLEWETKWERDTDYFVVQKLNGLSGEFETVGEKVESRGGFLEGALYKTADPNGNPGDTYRLVEYETTGRSSQHSTVKAKNSRPEVKPRKRLQTLSYEELFQANQDMSQSFAKPSGLSEKATAQGLTWVAIYPELFQEEITPLIAWRAAHGQESGGNTYEWVMATYGSIDAYIEHLWVTDGGTLEYILLVGDASACDYSTHCDQTVHDIIPTQRFLDGHDDDVYYSDVVIADIDSDKIPDIALGRIPALDEYDVVSYVNKVLTYENPPVEWAASEGEVSIFLHDKDAGFCSGEYVTKIGLDLAQEVPPTHNVNYFSWEELVPAPNYGEYADREALAIAEFDQGRALMVGVATSSNVSTLAYWLKTDWAEDDPFDASKLAPNQLPPFVIAASCDAGTYVEDWEDEMYPPLVEELLFASDRGAIGYFAPTSGTMQYANHQISSLMMKYFYEWGVESIGKACLNTQRRILEQDDGTAETARSYVYLGDPAIILVGSLGQDQDFDGILSDGDGSGIIGDNPCTGGDTENCDDNCMTTANPDQTDLDLDGIGDICDYYFPVSQVIPNHDSVVTSLGTSILAYFWEELDPATVNTASVLVRSDIRGAISASVTYYAGGKVIVCNPDVDFVKGERITVTLTSAITTAGGDPLEKGYSWSFSTTSCGALEGFVAGPTYDVSWPNGVVSADFNADGAPDLATCSYQNNQISVLLNLGDGQFGAATTLDLPPDARPADIQCADFNSDGAPDLVTSNKDNGTITIFQNNGSGDFSNQDHTSVPYASWGCYPADFNGDGFIDLLQADRVLYNDGTGSFTWADPIVNLDLSPFVADITGDGTLDILVTDRYNDRVRIVHNDHFGDFEVVRTLDVGNYPSDIISTDVDGDGHLDIVWATSDDLSVMRGHGYGNYSDPFPVSGTSKFVVSGDLDGNGVEELVVCRFDAVEILWFEEGVFTSETVNIASSSIEDVTLVDVNQDGGLDIVLAEFDPSGSVEVIYNTTAPDIPALVSPADGAEFVDMNTPTLDCSDVEHAIMYIFEIDEDPAFGSPLRSGASTTGNSQWTTPILPVGTHYWRVCAGGLCSNSPWSETRSLTITKSGPVPSCPVLFSYDGTRFVEENPLLTACEESGYTESVTDYYHVTNPIEPRDGQIVFQLRELEDEITYLDNFELITVDHETDTRAVCTVDGQIFTYKSSLGAISAVDQNGVDWTEVVSETDGLQFVADGPGHLTLVFKNTHVNSGISLGAPRKLPCPEDPPGGGPAKLAQQPADDTVIPSDFRIEQLSDGGDWIELSNVPARSNAVGEHVMSDILTGTMSENITIRLTWDGEFVTDEIRQYLPSDEEPVISVWQTAETQVSAHNPSAKRWSGFEGDGSLVLKKGESIELRFETDDVDDPTIMREYIVRAAGRYQPDYSVYSNLVPGSYQLYHNYPNPFNPMTRIGFDLPASSQVKLTVINVLGQTVATLVDRELEAGHHEVEWNANSSGTASGVYFYRLESDSYQATRKMLLLK